MSIWCSSNTLSNFSEAFCSAKMRSSSAMPIAQITFDFLLPKSRVRRQSSRTNGESLGCVFRQTRRTITGSSQELTMILLLQLKPAHSHPRLDPRLHAAVQPNPLQG